MECYNVDYKLIICAQLFFFNERAVIKSIPSPVIFGLCGAYINQSEVALYLTALFHVCMHA